MGENAPTEALKSMGKLFEEKTSETLKKSFQSVKETLARPEVTELMNKLNLASAVAAPLAYVFSLINVETMDERVTAMKAILDSMQSPSMKSAIEGMGHVLSVLISNLPALIQIGGTVLNILKETGVLDLFLFNLRGLVYILKYLSDQLNLFQIDNLFTANPVSLPPIGDYSVQPTYPEGPGGEPIY